MRNVGIVTDIFFFVRILVPLHGSRQTKKGHIQNIRFRSIDVVNLRFIQFRWYKVFLDGIGMDTVINFCQVAPDVPAKLFSLFVFQPLKFFDEIEFKLWRNPGGEIQEANSKAISLCA